MTTTSSAQPPTLPKTPKPPLAQHTKIFIGLAVGVVLGLLANALFGDYPELDWLLKNIISPLGQVFLRLIFMAVIPLIFSALALGVAELGDVRQLGRIGAKTFAYTLAVTTVSVIIGITLVNVFRPGEGLLGNAAYGADEHDHHAHGGKHGGQGRPGQERGADAARHHPAQPTGRRRGRV